MRNSKSYVTAFKQNKLIKPLKNEVSLDNFGSPSKYTRRLIALFWFYSGNQILIGSPTWELYLLTYTIFRSQKKNIRFGRHRGILFCGSVHHFCISTYTILSSWRKNIGFRTNRGNPILRECTSLLPLFIHYISQRKNIGYQRQRGSPIMR